MNNDQMLILSNVFIASFWLTWAGIITAAGGALIFYRIRINAIKDQNAELRRQVEERKELLIYSTANEQKLREEAAMANRTKSMLLARISHEIRTPMNGVIGMASLLNETPLTDEQQEYTETIRDCGESLLAVINDILISDILEYAKVESGKMELEQKDFDLRICIEEALDVFAGKVQPSVELLYRIDDDVPLQIIGDTLRLGQVLMNLVENAIKFTAAGEIFIGVHLLKTAEENQAELAFEIRDTGSGITADKIKLLSDEFSKANTSANRQEGPGLGLVICKRLIGLMGGVLKVDSDVEEGTTFRFTIRTKISTQSLHAHLYNEMAGLEGKKLLIVDDNSTNLHIIQHQLKQWKLVPAVAGSGKEALQLLSKAADFDLVLTDLQMPEMNGIELAQLIRQLYPALLLILLSPAGDDTDKQYPQLFNSVLRKPLKQHLLSKHIFNELLQGEDSDLIQEQHSKQKLSIDFSKNYPLRILIVEDNAVNQQLATKILNKLGYQPDVANSGEEALEVVSEKKYDIILMDVRMPQMDGLEATRMIRLCLSVQPVIIAMTANAMQGDREECLQAGMDDYITKPVKLEELVKLLEKWALQVKSKV